MEEIKFVEIKFKPLSEKGREKLNPLLEKYHQCPVIQEIWIHHFEREVLYGYYFNQYNKVYKCPDKTNNIGINRSLDNSVVDLVTYMNEGIVIADTVKRLDAEFNPATYAEIDIYNYLTSAEAHRRIGRLYADTATPGVSQSVIRREELESLYGIKIPSGGMENFAVDYGDRILYFHMDDSTFSHQKVQFNHFRYNDPQKGVMSFFDMEGGGSLIDYKEWAERLAGKPVLLWGYGPRLNESMTEEPYIFLGSHRGSVGLIADESFRLFLSNSEAL